MPWVRGWAARHPWPAPAQEAAYVAGKLNILATKCTAYVGSIKDLAAVQKAIAKQETLSLSLGGTQDTIDEGSHKAYIENGGGAAWRGQAEECVQLANEVAKYF